MRMTMRLRVHEWLAERVRWVQYPDMRKEHERQVLRARQFRPSLWWRYKAMTWRQLGWFWFCVFWSTVFLFAFISPSA